MIWSLFCFMITVNLDKFTLTISITKLSCKYLMKHSFVTEFRFAERDIIPWLSEVLQLPHKIVCCQETVANNIEVLCILLLNRLYLYRLSHMVPLLGRNPTEICDI